MVIASHQPVGPKATTVLLESLGEMVLLRLRHPLLALQHPVVIGQGEKVVTVFLIPVGDGFWEIITVAPQRMGVEISLPPASLGGPCRANHPEHGQCQQHTQPTTGAEGRQRNHSRQTAEAGDSPASRFWMLLSVLKYR